MFVCVCMCVCNVSQYHHYYKWMRERLHTALGLPAPPDTETCAIESATALCATDTESADRQATGTRPVVPSTVVDKMLDMNGEYRLFDAIVAHPALCPVPRNDMNGELCMHGDIHDGDCMMRSLHVRHEYAA